jgi:hypothetical protein
MKPKYPRRVPVVTTLHTPLDETRPHAPPGPMRVYPPINPLPRNRKVNRYQSFLAPQPRTDFTLTIGLLALLGCLISGQFYGAASLVKFGCSTLGCFLLLGCIAIGLLCGLLPMFR